MNVKEKDTIEKLYFSLQKIASLLHDYRILSALTSNGVKDVMERMAEKGAEVIGLIDTLYGIANA